MAALLVIASFVQVGSGSGGAAPSGPLGCLVSLAGIALLSVFSFLILRYRSFLRRSGRERADFTSLRSTGKTIVTSSPDDDDSDAFGGVN